MCVCFQTMLEHKLYFHKMLEEDYVDGFLVQFLWIFFANIKEPISWSDKFVYELVLLAFKCLVFPCWLLILLFNLYQFIFSQTFDFPTHTLYQNVFEIDSKMYCIHLNDFSKNERSEQTDEILKLRKNFSKSSNQVNFLYWFKTKKEFFSPYSNVKVKQFTSPFLKYSRINSRRFNYLASITKLWNESQHTFVEIQLEKHSPSFITIVTNNDSIAENSVISIVICLNILFKSWFPRGVCVCEKKISLRLCKLPFIGKYAWMIPVGDDDGENNAQTCIEICVRPF